MTVNREVVERSQPESEAGKGTRPERVAER